MQSFALRTFPRNPDPWIAQLDQILAQLLDAETQIGDFTGAVKSSQRTTSLKIDAAHEALDLLEIGGAQ